MLKIEQLDVKERSGRYLLKDISMEIPAGRVIGLTGKSGSGKTTLLRSILGMLHTSCHIDAGKILLDDIDLSHLSRKSHRELCGKKLGFIPQNPMTAFDSRLKIGYQMRETFVNRLHLNTSEATDLAKEKLVSVNLKDTDRILGAYPSELSGGMLQRVAAAILLGMSPDYVLADEPTAALDEENRDLLLLIMQEQMKDKGILFVSHDVAALKNSWSYDLDKANALLDEAGWVMNESTGIREKDGQQLSLNYTYWTDLSLAQDMALAIKTQLAEVGIDVTTTGQDQMTWWTEGVAGNYDITTWNTEGSYTEPHKFLQESLGADPHAISLQALEDFQSYSDAVNAFSTSADPEVVQSAIATALNVSNDNVIDLPISYSKDLVVYNSSKIAGYTFSSVPQFFEIDNVQPAE